MNAQYRQKQPNPSDSWIAPEHGRMAQGMRRFRQGIRDKDGLWLVRPGERVMPEPTCLRQQRESDHLLNRPANCKCEFCVREAKLAMAREQVGR